MRSSDSSGRNRPFEHLQSLLDRNQVVLENTRAPERPHLDSGTDDDDDRLFEQAMADVRPLAKVDRVVPPGRNRSGRRIERRSSDADAIRDLRELVASGNGFSVSDTAEYMSGTGPCVRPDVSARLHRGEFSIQTHLDLHGLSVVQAEAALVDFIREAIRSGKRGLLIIHGRGKSSQQDPVLKLKVCEWLTRGAWRNWILAFSSARLCDGGAGATYVLLRDRPVTKRFKKRNRRRPLR